MSSLLWFLIGVAVMMVVMIFTDTQQRRDFNDYIAKLEKNRDRWRNDYIAMIDERDQARDTNRRLNRRLQAVENFTNDLYWYKAFCQESERCFQLLNMRRAKAIEARQARAETARLREELAAAREQIAPACGPSACDSRRGGM